MADQVIGFILSGGGAKGSFSAGALEYLVRERRLQPSVVTGTSAGSICAAVLCQARSQDEFYSAAGKLREDILRMSVRGAAFVKQDWLSGLDGTKAGDDIENLIAGKARPPIPPDPTSTSDVLADTAPAAVTLRQGWEDLRSLITNIPAEHKALKNLTKDARSIMLLDPLEAALRGTTPGVGPSPIDEAAIARPGLRLRLTITALNDGCTRYVTESGTVVEHDALTNSPGAATPGVIEGVLASSSVPMVFAPRPIGPDVYVDGGVLENIPLAPAVTLGATDRYLVLADPLACPAPTMDYSSANLFEVAARAEITVNFYDQQRRDLAVDTPDGSTTTVIDPTVVAVSTFETEAGLLNINMDYGWLRACGETAGLADDGRSQAHQLADRLVTGRIRSWYLEAGLGGSGTDHDAALASAKQLIADSLNAWKSLGLALPAKADTWATSPELH